MFTYALIAGLVVILTVIALYFVHTYVMPRKIEEIARMIENGQTKLAIKKLNDLLEKDDRDPYVHYLLGEAYLADKNKQYAIVEYRQVLKLGRYNEKMREADIRGKLAALYMERKAHEEAKKEYLILTKIDPANYENYYELGKIFYNIGMLEKAIGFLKKAVQHNTNHASSYYYLGQIYYRHGAHADAKQALVQAIKIDPSNSKAHYFLGLVLRQQNDYEWAIKEFEIAQKSEALKVKCFLAKGSCHLERAQYPRAIIEFERGLKFSRKGTDIELNLRYFLAESQEKMRDIHSAIANWERISQVKNNFKDVQQKLVTYSEFRQDDRIKDFLIAGLAQFEHLARKIVESMSLNISEIEIISDTEIEIIAIDSAGKWRNTRQHNKIIRVIRTTDTIQEALLRKLHEKMRSKNATRIVVITTGEFSQPAVDFANTRPIELFGKTELVKLLQKI